VVSCAEANDVLPPGGTRHEMVLVNFEFDLSKPATYDVHAMNSINYGPATDEFSFTAGGQQFRAEADFQIQVIKGSLEHLAPAFHCTSRILVRRMRNAGSRQQG
jgi:hypothetical protein